MTFDERVRALEPFRFTPRQAHFLVTVALHGGYCLRRQYTAFAGVRYGQVVRAFLDGLVDRGLAPRESCRGDRGYVYHLYARSIYRALQQEDNRNRRQTSLAAIGRKLMLLDFVIAQPGVDWFATEVDKVALFTQRFGVPEADLPQRSYAAYGERQAATTRYLYTSCRSFSRASRRTSISSRWRWRRPGSRSSNSCGTTRASSAICRRGPWSSSVPWAQRERRRAASSSTDT